MGRGKRQEENGMASMGQDDSEEVLGRSRIQRLEAFQSSPTNTASLRFIILPVSFCAKILNLKARYYPREYLIDNAFSSNQSQSWQEIKHGMELLKKSNYLARWRWAPNRSAAGEIRGFLDREESPAMGG